MSRINLARSLCTLLIAALVASAGSIAVAKGHGSRTSESRPGRFDYYLVSLSWSPSFCELHPGETQQCGSKGYGFVLHGLWPQNRNGTWPQNCHASASPRVPTGNWIRTSLPSQL